MASEGPVEVGAQGGGPTVGDPPDSFEQRYAALLRVHVAAGRDDALREAHQLGRDALARGVGVTRLALAHHQALAGALAAIGAAVELRRVLDGAGALFAAALSPFEASRPGGQAATERSLDAELAAAREAAKAANEELEALSYSIAHDLRAPLRAIDGFSRALLDDCAAALDATGQSHLQRVRNAAQRMARLIDDLLQLSRIGRADLLSAPVDLSRLAETVVAELQKGDPGRTVEVVIAPGLTAQSDPHLLRVALENLLGNAWKFTANQPAARLELGCAPRDGELVYFVRDNGAGFDMTYVARLFAPFQRLHAESEFPGSGIGLATVQRIVRRHGGRIWAEGVVGQGATFFWTIAARAGGPFKPCTR